MGSSVIYTTFVAPGSFAATEFSAVPSLGITKKLPSITIESPFFADELPLTCLRQMFRQVK